MIQANELQKVLVVDDVVDNRQMLNDLLKDDYTVILAKSGEQALERALQHLPDVILLDVMMPGMSGYEVMSCLQMDVRTASITVILITGLDSADDETKGLLHGATDYIVKPFNPAVVRTRVSTQMKMARQRHMLEQLANIDGLTELPNRHSFEATFEIEWQRAQRDGKPLAVAMLKIDHFRQYNDTHGYIAGDRILKSLAKLLQYNLKRPADTVARYANEEFVLLMPDTNNVGAQQLTENLRQMVAEQLIGMQQTEEAIRVSVNIGVAATDGLQVESPMALLKIADAQLQQARQAAGNRVL